MKEIDIKLTPKNTNLPEREFKGVTDLEVVAENLYYDIYDLEIKSQWYEDVSQEINFTGEKVAEEIELPIRKGTVTIRLGSKATLEIYDQVVTNDTRSMKNYTFEIPYDDEPYPLEVTHPWRRGQTVEITINPSQSEQEKTLTGGQIKPAKVVIKFTDRNGRAWTKELRTTYGNWTYNITEDGYVPENVKVLVEEDVVEVNQYLKTHEIKEEIETVKIPFDYKEEEDDQLLAEESYIKIPGEDGQKRVTYKVTYIDGEQTEKTLISQSTIKSPTHQVKVIGTKDIEWKRELKSEKILAYKRITQEDANVFPKDSYVKTPGQNGYEKIYHEVEYVNGAKSGRTRSQTTDRKEPINEIYIKGTKVVIEWKKEFYRNESIPFTTRTEYDSNRLPNQSYYRVQGINGVRTYYREYEYKDGVKTHQWRNETSTITTQMRQAVYVEGTKVAEKVFETSLSSYVYRHDRYYIIRGTIPSYITSNNIEKVEMGGYLFPKGTITVDSPNRLSSFRAGTFQEITGEHSLSSGSPVKIYYT